MKILSIRWIEYFLASPSPSPSLLRTQSTLVPRFITSIDFLVSHLFCNQNWNPFSTLYEEICNLTFWNYSLFEIRNLYNFPLHWNIHLMTFTWLDSAPEMISNNLTSQAINPSDSQLVMGFCFWIKQDRILHLG